MRAASLCSSDSLYRNCGSRKVLGHELAGMRENGTPVVVEALYGCMDCTQQQGAIRVVLEPDA